MKDIREALFAKYSEEVEATPPTEAERIYLRTPGADEDESFSAAVAMMNDEAKEAYMAGFDAAAAAYRALMGINQRQT